MRYGCPPLPPSFLSSYLTPEDIPTLSPNIYTYMLCPHPVTLVTAVAAIIYLISAALHTTTTNSDPPDKANHHKISQKLSATPKETQSVKEPQGSVPTEAISSARALVTALIIITLHQAWEARDKARETLGGAPESTGAEDRGSKGSKDCKDCKDCKHSQG